MTNEHTHTPTNRHYCKQYHYTTFATQQMQAEFESHDVTDHVIQNQWLDWLNVLSNCVVRCSPGQGFIQTSPGEGVITPLVFMQHPLACIQQRRVLRGVNQDWDSKCTRAKFKVVSWNRELKRRGRSQSPCGFIMLYEVLGLPLLPRQDWRGYAIVRSVILSFVLSLSSVTHDRGNGRRPNVVGTGKGRPTL